MKRSRASPATAATNKKQKRITPDPEISAVAVQQQTWDGGSTQLVTWSSQGEVAKVDIDLHSFSAGHTRFFKNLANDLSNTGSKQIKAPPGLAPGKYCVHVESSNNRNVFAESNAFTFVCATPPVISAVAVQQQIWHGGSTQLVTWSSQGEVAKVDIDLHSFSAGRTRFFKSLANNLSNTGSKQIKVPRGLTPGKYCVHVESSNNRNVHAESSAFTVVCATPPVISAVAVQQQTWDGGSTQLVTWSSQGEVAKVDIDLHMFSAGHTRFFKNLANDLSNTGSKQIKAPPGLAPGKYCVHVESSNNRNVFAESNAFTFVCATPPVISAVAVQQQIWHGGSTQLVTWSSQGEVAKVDIDLHSFSAGRTRFFKSLANNLSNTGSKQIKVPRGLTPGKYCVHVESSNNRNVHAESSAFTCDDEHRERCVRYALLLLGLPPLQKLPYAIVRKIAVEAATE